MTGDLFEDATVSTSARPSARSLTAAQRQASIDAHHAELGAAFLARRCACGASATVVIVGSEAVREVGITTRRAKPDVNLCSFHAGLGSNQEAA